MTARSEEAVAVAGVGIHGFGRHPDKSFGDLARPAVDEALERAGVEAQEIEEVFVGNALGPNGVGERVAQACGMFRVPVTRVEQACASSSTALRLAADLVATGRRRAVLVVGVERMSSGLLDLGDSTSYDARMGTDVLPLLYGLKATQYMRAYDVASEALAAVAMDAHVKALDAPFARFGLECTVDDVMESPMIAEPMTRLQLAGNADGATAAVVVAGDHPSASRGVKLLGWCGALEWHDPSVAMDGGWDHREHLTAFLADRLYDQVGVRPDEFDVVQLNDASSVAVPLYIEALRLADRGSGIDYLSEGAPVNTDGGLLGRGHCLGATGLAMLNELWLQLMGEAGPRQVEGAELGLLHSHGYGGDNVFAVAR